MRSVRLWTVILHLNIKDICFSAEVFRKLELAGAEHFSRNAEHLQIPATRGLEPSWKGVKACRIVTLYDENIYCFNKMMNIF